MGKLILRIQNFEVSFNSIILFKVGNLEIFEGDKIAFIAPNGAGKTTLLNAIFNYEKGILINSKVAYFKQLEKSDLEKSSGETVFSRFKEMIFQNSGIYLIDEPTANLDIRKKKEVAKLMSSRINSFILVSHDAHLIKTTTNKTMTIENGEVKLYGYGYDEYLRQKETDRSEYERNLDKKKSEMKKLKEAHSKLERARNSVKKAPKRMGNSEARLHRRESTQVQKKISQHMKALESRMDRVEITEKRKRKDLSIKFGGASERGIRYPIIATDLSIVRNREEIIHESSFAIERNKKNFLIGENASGKTSIINEILSRNSNVEIQRGLLVGVFCQDNLLKEEKTVMEYVYNDKVPKNEMLTVLVNLKFNISDIDKRVFVLSGGERVKLKLAKMIIDKCDLIILDEPTNYLDIDAISILKNALWGYNGTVLVVSHDEEFISELAQRILYIEDKKVKTFEGKYDEYLKKDEIHGRENIIKLEVEMASLLDKLGDEKKLERYIEIKRIIEVYKND